MCVSKVTDYMPTPVDLECFCNQCCHLPEKEHPHQYKLFGVVMHLGTTLESGHYIAFVKASHNVCQYLNCHQEKKKLRSASSKVRGSSTGIKMDRKLKFTSTCRSADCCSVLLNMNRLDDCLFNITHLC